jgi:outer membrane receptor protein involved in Fe transport
LAERLRLIAGARWFNNKVTFNGAQDGALVSPDTFAGAQEETGINPKVSIEYQATKDARLYATASKGFRIGGVNSFSNLLCAGDLAALGLTSAQVLTFDSDSLWNYEIGAKTSWLNRKVIANGALFDIEWSDVQQNVALPTCGFFLTMNAGKARSRGFELELSVAPADGLLLSFGTGYTDAVITNGGILATIAPGTRVQQIPRWTVSASADYDVHLSGLPMVLHMDYANVGESYSANNDPVNQRLRPAYSLVNARVGMNFQHWEVALFADNVFDKAANLSDIPPLAIEYPGRPRIVTNRPRTLGIEGRYRFR